MNGLRVAAIVEGHGEVNSVPILLSRIWRELLDGDYVDVIHPPIRQPRDRLAQNKDDALVRAVSLAAAKLQQFAQRPEPQLILVMIDADRDPPCVLGPRMLQVAQDARRDRNVACVIATVEYETWFVAAAQSLVEYLNLDDTYPMPVAPEAERYGKGWIERRFRGVRYSETIDQPKLTKKMDLAVCRERSPSFDKLCRELEKLR